MICFFFLLRYVIQLNETFRDFNHFFEFVDHRSPPRITEGIVTQLVEELQSNFLFSIFKFGNSFFFLITHDCNFIIIFEARYQPTVKSPPKDRGVSSKWLDPSVCPTGGDFFFSFLLGDFFHCKI
jgi:hypothetical protein